LFVLLTVVCGSLSAAEDRSVMDRLAQDIRVLSSDLFEGRAPGTPGEDRSIGWIGGQFMSIAGLEPGGDPGAGGREWTQAVALKRSSFTSPIEAGFTIGKMPLNLQIGESFSLTAPQVAAGKINLRDVPVVFAGYGVQAPELHWDDFKGLDVRGKLLIVLVNDPDYESGVGDFRGKAMTWYGRWPYKFEQAARLGAAGVLIVHETGPAGYDWNVWQYNHLGPSLDVVRARPQDRHPLIEGYLRRDVAVELFRQVGLDFEVEKKAAAVRGFVAKPLADTRFSIGFEAEHDRIVSRNVVAFRKGRDRADELVIYSAHFDHLGIGKPDKDGDAIYNGAQDNASGTAMLLELARRFAAAEPPRRSMLFLALTAEESGLLGSEHYAAHPLYPHATTAAVLNMDGMNMTGRTVDAGAAGDGQLTLQDDLIRVLESRGRTFLPEAHPEAGYFYRSDHFPFAKVGVPALSFRAGMDKRNGGIAAGEAAYAAYIRDRYHQPADEWSEDMDLSGMVDDLEVLYTLGREIADSDQWPQWKEGSEFKVVRDASAAERAP
jgi:Zn-dependent M28 family amino/carboxypeptidase